MPPWLSAKTLGLPRWVWVAVVVGGVGIGLYVRHTHKSEPEPEPESEPQTIGGNPVSPAAPIEAAGGGIPPVGQQHPSESEKPEMVPLPEELLPAGGLELPESKPPPETVVQEPNKTPVQSTPIVAPVPQPVHNTPISAPGTPGIGQNHPATSPIGIGPAVPVAGASNQAEKEKARNEIARLQNEINGLQNHINQLTQVIQAHPKAKQRGQWESERNQDRTNIEGKRNLVVWWQGKL